MEVSVKLPMSKDTSPDNSKKNTLPHKEYKSAQLLFIPTSDQLNYLSGIQQDKKNLEVLDKDIILVLMQLS
jgi:ribosomal protein L7Ae-like RNA K-turn-binding protein